jgi:flagellar motility protein MotE (MotC chaperone)
MKYIIIGLIGAIVVGFLIKAEHTTDYKNDSVEVVEIAEVVEPTEELDVIDKARQELERIDKELDVKETELLEQRKEIDAELERLRQTRVSFQ